MTKLNGYDLSRAWFDFAFENPEKIKPLHCAIFFFAIEHCNRLGWKNKFGFPSQMTMDALGIKKHQTYMNGLNDLIEWGFIIMITKSKNQYSANIISLSDGKQNNGNSLDQAFICHAKKRQSTGQSTGQSSGQSMDSINKQVTSNKEQEIESDRQIFETIKSTYQNHCSNMPAIAVLSSTRKTLIKARVKEHGLNTVIDVIKQAGKSSFLCGDNDKGWKANFDWLLNAKNFIKILEGNYANKHQQQPLKSSNVSAYQL